MVAAEGWRVHALPLAPYSEQVGTPELGCLLEKERQGGSPGGVMPSQCIHFRKMGIHSAFSDDLFYPFS